jgi:hypothetical protein
MQFNTHKFHTHNIKSTITNHTDHQGDARAELSAPPRVVERDSLRVFYPRLQRTIHGPQPVAGEGVCVMWRDVVGVKAHKLWKAKECA